MPSNKKKPEAAVKLVHRITARSHRLESHGLTESPRLGEFVPLRAIARLDTFAAVVDSESELPKVFRVSAVPAHEVVD